MEVPILVDHENVTGDVPATLHVDALTRVGEISAAEWTLHCKTARSSDRHRFKILVDHLRDEAGHGLACGSRHHVVNPRRDEDVQHLGSADAIDEFETGRVTPGLPGGLRQVLTSGDAASKAGQPSLRQTRHHRAIRGGSSEQTGDPVLGDLLQQYRG